MIIRLARRAGLRPVRPDGRAAREQLDDGEYIYLSLSLYTYIYIYMYTHVCICVCVYIYIYMYTYTLYHIRVT